MRFGRVLGALLAGAVFLGGSNAFAEGTEDQDEITMKDGGTLRGTVVSVEPGTQVKVIEMGTATVRTIPWSQVADVERGKYAPKAKVEPGDAGPGYGSPAAPLAAPVAPLVTHRTTPSSNDAAHKVRLHIETPKPVWVRSPNATTTTYVGNVAVGQETNVTVCASPCDQEIPFNDGDVFVAHGNFPGGAKTFSLAEMGDSADLDVKPGSAGRRDGGIASIVGGSVVVVIGVGLALGGALQTSGYDPGLNQVVQVDEQERRNLEIAGGCVTGVGIGLVALGAWLVGTSGSHWALHPSGTPASTVEAWIAPPSPLGSSERSMLPRGMIGGVRGRF